jgi:hypothetical protein
MRRKHTKRQKRQKIFRSVLRNALSLVSHVVAIIGTIVAIVDLIHHW